MKKYIILVISLCFLLCSCEITPQIEKEEQVIDGLNFKVEYENYNNTNYQLNIDKDNNFKYIDMNNINKVFSSKNIIFIGDPKDDKSRYTVNTLIKLKNDYNIDIYYYNYEENNPKYEITDEKLEKTKDGTELYNEMLKRLEKYITQLNIEKDNKVYSTEEKIFSNPALVFIVNKEIYGYYDEFEFDVTKNNVVLTEQYQKLIIEGFDQITKQQN
jgi:hypothetical protein